MGGDFRVQRDFGGSAQTADPSPRLIAQAQAVLEAIEADLLYARVDAIERDGQLFLMELELIEPHLFFEQDPASSARFAEALQKRMVVKQ